MGKWNFSQLKKLAAEPAQELPVCRLALLGDSATQHLATALKGCARADGFALELFEAEYDEVNAQILDPNSELYQFAPDAVLLYLCSEKLYDRYCRTKEEERPQLAQQVFDEIAGYWDRLGSAGSMKILQYNFVELDDRIFGDYAFHQEGAFITQLRRLNELLQQGCMNRPNVFLLDLQRVQNQLGRDHFFDPKLYYIARMPISLGALGDAAGCAIKLLAATLGKVKKCVVLDLDNTLWGGVIGDDGINGIQLGELGLGRAYTDLQRWLKELRRRGILLAVCSKNDHQIALEPFEKHPEMILRKEDIALFVANWEDKASNIRNIQQTLNIGMDSMVFLDDNPFEREAVRSLIPEICVPELPEDPAQYLSYLQSLDLFTTLSYSETDRVRTQQYQAESGRRASQGQFADYDEYLKSLDMRALAAPFDAFQTPRIAQLTQRSNQFNLRTVRYTEAEIQAVAADPSYLTLYFTLEDRFGDYGLIGVVILQKMENKTAFVDTWLMSCRVLRRGMEEFIADKIVETAAAHGFSRVVGEYLPTAKNRMVEHLYEQVGFEPVGDGRYAIDVAAYRPHKIYIKEKEQ